MCGVGGGEVGKKRRKRRLMDKKHLKTGVTWFNLDIPTRLIHIFILTHTLKYWSFLYVGNCKSTLKTSKVRCLGSFFL